MANDDDRTWVRLTAHNERLSDFFRDKPSAEEVVRTVTNAFKDDVARIMGAARAPSNPPREDVASRGGEDA